MPRKNSIAPGKSRVNFDDDQPVVERMDELAQRLGQSRSDIYRQATRFFLTNYSIHGIIRNLDQLAETTNT